MTKKRKKLFEWYGLTDMIDTIVGIMGERHHDGDNDFYEGYRERNEYDTRTFKVTTYPVPEIKYKGKLVFRAADKRTYYKTGRWEKEFGKLHSRACNILDSWHSEWDNTGYND